MNSPQASISQPFVLSLSKETAGLRTGLSKETADILRTGLSNGTLTGGAWFDRLTTNGV